MLMVNDQKSFSKQGSWCSGCNKGLTWWCDNWFTLSGWKSLIIQWCSYHHMTYGTLELTDVEKTRNYQENNHQLMHTTPQECSLLPWKKHGKQQGGPVEFFVSCWRLQRWFVDWSWQTCTTNLNVVSKSSGNNFQGHFFKTSTNYNPGHREQENWGELFNQTIACFHCPKIVRSKKPPLCTAKRHTYSLYVLDVETTVLGHQER